MGRTPCCEKMVVRKGPWSKEEDQILINYIKANGHANWRSLPKDAGLSRCGKSCRLRWMNYLRPDIKRGRFTHEEEATIVKLHETIGNKWAKIAARLPGRTDNEIKNVWNTRLKKRLHEFAARPADDQVTDDNNLGIPEKDNPLLGVPENDVNFAAAAQNNPATNNVEPHLSSSTAAANNVSERLLMESDFRELDVYRFWTQVNDIVGPDNHKSSGFDFNEYIPVVNEVGGPSSGTQFLQDNLSWISDELLLDNIWNY